MFVPVLLYAGLLRNRKGQAMLHKKKEEQAFAQQEAVYRTERERRRMEEQKKQEEKKRKPGRIAKSAALWIFQILVVVMFAYVLVFFFGQTRTNIGQSMDVTLSGGDTVLLNVLTYELGSPKRGDIVSFKANGSDTSHSLIKRIIGLPGETVQIKDGMIYIDGTIYLEQKSYPAITSPGMAAEPITLGDKEYFVLGDNRNNSEDSRFADIGAVHANDIEGKVWFILSPGERRGFVE